MKKSFQLFKIMFILGLTCAIHGRSQGIGINGSSFAYRDKDEQPSYFDYGYGDTSSYDSDWQNRAKNYDSDEMDYEETNRPYTCMCIWVRTPGGFLLTAPGE